MDKVILDRLASFNLSMQQKKDLVDIIKYIVKTQKEDDKEHTEFDNAYGIEWVKGSNVCTRIGNMKLHKTCPIQNRLRGCLHSGKNILHWLNPDGWGLPMDNGEIPVLDGSMGDVGVAMPLEYFVKIIDLKDKYQIWISDENIDGDWIRISPCIYSPHCALTRINSAGKEEVFNACIKKDDESHIGGDKNEDNKDNLHGRPRTIQSLNQAIEFCKNRGNGIKIIDYLHYAALQLLFYIEYATFDFKKPVDKELTQDGFKQGGLGIGISCLHEVVEEGIYCPYLYTYFCIESNVGNNNFCNKPFNIEFENNGKHIYSTYPCYFHGIHFIGDLSILIGDILRIGDIKGRDCFKLYKLKKDIDINNIDINNININNIEEKYDYINTFGSKSANSLYVTEFNLNNGLYFMPDSNYNINTPKNKCIINNFHRSINDIFLIKMESISYYNSIGDFLKKYDYDTGFMTIVDLD